MGDYNTERLKTRIPLIFMLCGEGIVVFEEAITKDPTSKTIHFSNESL